MSVLGGGLSEARHHEDALSVYEAELAMERRLGASEKTIFAVQTNLASTYMVLGRKKRPIRSFETFTPEVLISSARTMKGLS